MVQFEVSLITPGERTRVGLSWVSRRFEIKSEYGAVSSNEMRDLFESTTLRHRLMWLDGFFGSKLNCLKRIS